MNFSYSYWVRTTVGLEEIFLRELAAKFAIAIHKTRHRSVFFELQEKIAEDQLCASLHTADDIYRFLGQQGGIGKTKQSVQKIGDYFIRHVLPVIPQSQRVRVTASFLGERNFNRYYIENLLSNMLSTQANATVLSNENGDKWQEGELRIRVHVEDDQAYFGVGLQDKPLHRRPWRAESYAAQLHPPLAAAMAFIAQPAQASPVVDPFCGSGTILIESALQYGGVRHIGFDTDATAINIAQQNADLAGVTIELQQADFIDHYKNISNYTLISNPPWGEKHSMNENNLIDNLLVVISKSRAAVILVPEELRNKLRANGMVFKEICTTRVRGKLASLIHIIRAS